MAQKTKVTWEHPEYGDVVFELSAEERTQVDQAVEYLDLDYGLFFNAAHAWVNEEHPKWWDEYQQEFAKRTLLTNRQTEGKYKHRTRGERTKRFVVKFAEFVLREQPEPSRYDPRNG